MPQTSPASSLSPHQLTVFELDRSVPLVKGKNPLQIAVLQVPHEVTIPRREAAARPLIEAHTHRRAVEINHTPGDNMTAIVLKG